jgi:hypothetical protein
MLLSRQTKGEHYFSRPTEKGHPQERAAFPSQWSRSPRLMVLRAQPNDEHYLSRSHQEVALPAMRSASPLDWKRLSKLVPGGQQLDDHYLS